MFGQTCALLLGGSIERPSGPSLTVSIAAVLDGFAHSFANPEFTERSIAPAPNRIRPKTTTHLFYRPAPQLHGTVENPAMISPVIQRQAL